MTTASGSSPRRFRRACIRHGHSALRADAADIAGQVVAARLATACVSAPGTLTLPVEKDNSKSNRVSHQEDETNKGCTLQVVGYPEFINRGGASLVAPRFKHVPFGKDATECPDLSARRQSGMFALRDAPSKSEYRVIVARVEDDVPAREGASPVDLIQRSPRIQDRKRKHDLRTEKCPVGHQPGPLHHPSCPRTPSHLGPLNDLQIVPGLPAVWHCSGLGGRPAFTVGLSRRARPPHAGSESEAGCTRVLAEAPAARRAIVSSRGRQPPENNVADGQAPKGRKTAYCRPAGARENA